MKRPLLLVATAALVAVAGQAATIISVQSGGITLNSTNTGTAGTQADPWTISESMTGAGVLQFLADPNGSPVGPENTTDSGHSTGRWISKSVTNNTGIAWTSFEVELQLVLGTPSGQGDGLSFADGSAVAMSFSSDVFPTYTRIDIARDYLNFSGGVVNPGQTVTFNFVITDNFDNNPFYLLQTPNRADIGETPEPSTWAMFGSALIGAGLLRRRLHTK